MQLTALLPKMDLSTKVSHRGHEITVTREKSMMGEETLFYAIFRESDGFECTSGHSSGDESVGQMVEIMKERVDNELAEEDPWCEQGS